MIYPVACHKIVPIIRRIVTDLSVAIHSSHVVPLAAEAPNGHRTEAPYRQLPIANWKPDTHLRRNAARPSFAHPPASRLLRRGRRRDLRAPELAFAADELAGAEAGDRVLR